MHTEMSRISKVHHLVLETFVGPRPRGLVACHNDGNKFNNCSSNLRWDTPTSNYADARKHGSYLKGEQIPNSRFKTEDIVTMRTLAQSGTLISEIAKKFDTAYQVCWDIIKRRRWKHLP